MPSDLNETIRDLIERWCDRRQYGALATLLPAWISNNGLTDGWTDLRDAVKSTYTRRADLPFEERDELKRVYIAIDVALQNRK
jgi:hypothetical protein